jgi:hypothetical protein
MLVMALFLSVAVVPVDTNTPAASESVNVRYVRFPPMADIDGWLVRSCPEKRTFIGGFRMSALCQQTFTHISLAPVDAYPGTRPFTAFANDS